MTPALLCLVVAISDGDTLKVRCEDRPQMTLRINAIDAPEKKQPFGEVSRQHLAQLCFQQQAAVWTNSKDRYGRSIAEVKCQGKDVATEQVRAGMAWVYVKYAQKDSPLFNLEAAARAGRAGLWAQEAVPPWVWRKMPTSSSPESGGSSL